MNALIGAKAAWYLMRASGFVAFGLLTLTVVLGIANVARWERGRWARAVAALVHQNASLLAVVFLVIHVLTAISDKYVSIPALAVFVPGLSGYDPLWTGLGALSLDIMLALILTSLLRARVGHRTWRVVHWLAYVSWPVALVHAIGAGSGDGVDTGHLWATAIYVGLGLLVAVAIAVRLATKAQWFHVAPDHPRLGTARRPRPVTPAQLAVHRAPQDDQDEGARPTTSHLPVLTTTRSL
jgi:methionine sulfoxide reductase heme-binding subunit